MMRAWWCGVLLACSGCFTAWDVGGPWACTEDGKCPNSLVCDDGDPQGLGHEEGKARRADEPGPPCAC